MSDPPDDEDDDRGWRDADSVIGDEGSTRGTSGSGGGLDLDPEVAAAISYLFLPWMGLAILLADEDDEFVRFHALQSIILSIAFTVVYMVLFGVVFAFSALTLGFGVILAIPLLFALSAAIFGYDLYVAYRAYEGDRYEVPYVGTYASERV